MLSSGMCDTNGKYAKYMQDIEELISLPPEKVLLKWMNFHLKKAGYKKTVANFSSDLKVDYSFVIFFRCKLYECFVMDL